MESNQLGNAATQELNLLNNYIGTISSGSKLMCHEFVQHKIHAPIVTPPHSNTERVQTGSYPVLTSILESQIGNSKAKSNTTPIMICENTLKNSNQAVNNLPAPIVTPQQSDMSNKQIVRPSEVVARHYRQRSNMKSELNQAMPVIAPKYIHNNGIQDMNRIIPLMIPRDRNVTGTGNQNVGQQISVDSIPVDGEIFQQSNLNSEVNQSGLILAIPQYIYNINKVQDINRIMPLVVPHMPPDRSMNSNQEVGQQTAVQREILQQSDLSIGGNQPTPIVTPQCMLKNQSHTINQPMPMVASQCMFKNQSHTVNQPTPMVAPQQRTVNTTSDAHW